MGKEQQNYNNNNNSPISSDKTKVSLEETKNQPIRQEECLQQTQDNHPIKKRTSPLRKIQKLENKIKKRKEKTQKMNRKAEKKNIRDGKRIQAIELQIEHEKIVPKPEEQRDHAKKLKKNSPPKK